MTIMHKIAKLLPIRPSDAHKGNCGRVGIIAGSASMLGAGILTALAALKTGSGLVYLMTVKEAVPWINIQYPELIVFPLPSKNGFITSKAWSIIKKNIELNQINTLAIGPGLGHNKEIKDLVQKILQYLDQNNSIPTVLDADALKVITANKLRQFKNLKLVLTPHPKEFELLFECFPKTKEDILTLAQEAAENIGQVIILKGQESIVARPKEIEVNPTGNPGMATAGAGDVLTGIVASLIGQGLEGFEAAVLGTYLHGLAGDLGAEKQTMYSLTALDIIAFLPFAFKSLVN